MTPRVFCGTRNIGSRAALGGRSSVEATIRASCASLFSRERTDVHSASAVSLRLRHEEGVNGRFHLSGTPLDLR